MISLMNYFICIWIIFVYQLLPIDPFWSRPFWSLSLLFLPPMITQHSLTMGQMCVLIIFFSLSLLTSHRFVQRYSDHAQHQL